MDSFSKFCWGDIAVGTGIAVVEVFSCDMSNPNLNDSALFPLSVLPKQTTDTDWIIVKLNQQTSDAQCFLSIVGSVFVQEISWY